MKTNKFENQNQTVSNSASKKQYYAMIYNIYSTDLIFDILIALEVKVYDGRNTVNKNI